MKISKLFTNWFIKTGKENKTSSRDDYYQKRREIIEDEHERLKKWRKKIKQRMSSNYIYSTSIGHVPGGYSGSTITASNVWNDTTIQDNTTLKASALEIDGRDILKELDEMRDALLLLKRDVDMEAKYPRLKELKDEYERAIEKYKTFDTIKDSK